jgi:hypothetical protein
METSIYAGANIKLFDIICHKNINKCVCFRERKREEGNI